MPNILLVEDEKKLHTLVKHALEKEGFQVFSAYEGFKAHDLIQTVDFDVAILDVMLPGIDGWRLLKTAKEKNMAVIMTTARAMEEDKLFGFELGTDDYLTKPFSLKELIARVKVLLKRTPSLTPSKELLTCDEASRMCKLNGQPIHLSLIEFNLLNTFLKHPHQVLTRDQLLNLVWGYDYYGDPRTVDTHVKRLRKKLAPFKCIHTARGVGYLYEVHDV